MDILDKLKNKKSKLYFMDIDHKGQYNEITDYFYQVALYALNQGYEVFILHENDEYSKPVYTDKYDNLNHISYSELTKKEIKISASDFIFVMEYYIEVVKQFKEQKIPAEIVLIAANYSAILPSLQIGDSWLYLNVKNVIVPNEQVKNYCSSFFKGINYHVFYSDIEAKDDNLESLPNPTITLYSGNMSKMEDLTKGFFLKYPQYTFLPMKTLENSEMQNIYKQLKESSCLIILDDTLPMYDIVKMALNVGTNVLGINPKLPPEWMLQKTDKGVNLKYGEWTNNPYLLFDFIAGFIDQWISDTHKPQQIVDFDPPLNDNFIELIVDKRIQSLETVIKNK